MNINKLWQSICLTLVPMILLTACPQADFALSSTSTSISIVQGGNQQVSIHLERLNGFQDSVTLSLIGAPSGVTGKFSPASISANSTQLTLNVLSNASLGSSVLVVSGTGGVLTRTMQISLNITNSTSSTIIPETTKVADLETRTALNAIDLNTGTMRFSQDTKVLQNLKSGDVLVGGRSSIAPFGFLRKVNSIKTENGQTVLKTTQAALTDAISKGSIDITKNFTAADVVSTSSRTSGNSQAGKLLAGYNFEQPVKVVYHPDPPGTGEVQITGVVNFNLGAHFGLKISTCSTDTGIPYPCVGHFDTWVGFDQLSDLKITGHLETPIKKDIELASKDYQIDFDIAGVPIVLDFKATLSIGLDGQASVQFSYNATQNAALQFGAAYNDGHGWDKIDDRTFAVLPGTPQLQGNVKLQATTDVEGQVLLYGIVGPGLKASAGLEFDAQIPRNPIWILSGVVLLDVTFVVDIPVFGKIVDYSTNIANWKQEFARSRNSPPSINILKGIQNVNLGKPLQILNSIYGTFTVSDLEDGTVPDSNIHLSSDKDGALTLNSNAEFLFATEGIRVITVTATDSTSASSSATFTVNVNNPPPVVSLTTSANLPVYRGIATQLSGYANDINRLTGQPTDLVPCNQMSWTSSVASDVVPASCTGNVTFTSNGSRTLTLTAIGKFGAKGSASVTINVTDPPPNLAPVIDEFHIKDNLGNEVGDGQVVTTNVALNLTVKAHDPENDQIHYVWSACLKGWTALQCSLNGNLPTNADGSSSFLGVGTYTFWITADDGQHTYATIASRTITINPAVR